MLAVFNREEIMLNRKHRFAEVSGKLRFGKGAGITVVKSSGAEVFIDAEELARQNDVAGRTVLTTAAALTVTQAAHEGKVVVLASTHTQTVTLPAATGSGARYRFLVSTTGTDGSKVIQVANTADVMTGVCASHSTATNQASSFLTSATSDTVTLNNTTQGGITGTQVEILDIATATFFVKVEAAASGTVATPFSAAV